MLVYEEISPIFIDMIKYTTGVRVVLQKLVDNEVNQRQSVDENLS